MKFFDPIFELLKFRQAYACPRMVDIAGKIYNDYAEQFRGTFE